LYTPYHSQFLAHRLTLEGVERQRQHQHRAPRACVTHERKGERGLAPTTRQRHQVAEHRLEGLVDRCRGLKPMLTGVVHPCSADALGRRSGSVYWPSSTTIP
jgi:hypothetical protein